MDEMLALAPPTSVPPNFSTIKPSVKAIRSKPFTGVAGIAKFAIIKFLEPKKHAKFADFGSSQVYATHQKAQNFGSFIEYFYLPVDPAAGTGV